MPALHLIQNQTDPKLLPKPEKLGSDQWLSGFWSLSEATVRSLVGGRVYFHKAQAKPAFLGGDLLEYHVAGEPPFAGRIIQANPVARESIDRYTSSQSSTSGSAG